MTNFAPLKQTISLALGAACVLHGELSRAHLAKADDRRSARIAADSDNWADHMFGGDTGHEEIQRDPEIKAVDSVIEHLRAALKTLSEDDR